MIPGLQYMLPAGLVRLWHFQNRFRALGLEAGLAYRQEYRKALEMSLVELLPLDLLPSLDCVVDVGANRGDWSIGIAMLTQAREIIAYEPVPEMFARLQKETRGFPQIHPINRAVGAAPGEVAINLYEMSEFASVLTLGTEAGRVHNVSSTPTDTIRVPMTTLDQDLSDRDEISLLKLDVQGYEPAVIAGAREIFKRTRVLMMEVTYASYYEGDLQFQDLNALVTGVAPFKLWGISAPHCAPSGKPMWADAVYVRNETK